MEANELYNFSISPLVTDSFSLEWSEDNHISLITHRGVHVFEFLPDPTSVVPTLKFWRTFIHPSENLPAESLEKFVNKEIWKMKREEMYSLLLQEAITPKIDDKTAIKPRITKIVWSPLKLAIPSKCLTAIVTSAGSIEILYKLNTDWLSVWNVTDLWCDLVKIETKIDPCDLGKNSFDKISWHEHAKRFIGTAACWSPIFVNSHEKYAHLVAGFRSFHLIVTKIWQIDFLKNMTKPEIIYEKLLGNSSRINQLSWIPLDDAKHLIVIGYNDGKIHGLRIIDQGDRFVDDTFFRYEDRVDRMKITSLRFIKRQNDIIVLATKSSCLVAIGLDLNGESLKTRYLRIDGFSITGLTVMDEKRLILTTQNAKMYSITINEQGDMNLMKLMNDLKSSKVQYLGTTRSSNGTILLNVTSPDGMYDHLICREPSVIQLFTLRGEDWNPWRIIKEKLLKKRSLNEYWDCMETLRIEASKNDDGKKILPKLPEVLDGLEINELRTIKWLKLFKKILENKQTSKMFEKKRIDDTDTEQMIFLTSACDHLCRLSMKKSLTNDEKKSASFLRMYMEIYIAGEEDNDNDSEITKNVMRTFNSSSHLDTIEIESCNLCGEILTELPWLTNNCPLGHKLSRCSITLLQITDNNYRYCPSCGRLFHSSLDQEEIRCLYCDLPASWDNRVRNANDDDDDYENKWINLSKRSVKYNQPENHKINNDLENRNDTSANNEKNRRNSIDNPHTVVVIVNGDENDESHITETWQEF